MEGDALVTRTRLYRLARVIYTVPSTEVIQVYCSIYSKIPPGDAASIVISSGYRQMIFVDMESHWTQ